MKTVKEYFLYDNRYYHDPDSAICFEVCETLREARANGPDYGDAVIVETISKKVGARTFDVVSSKIVY